MAQPRQKTDLPSKYGALVDCIADLLGPNAEVVLHDVSHTERSIIMIRNGHVTGRMVGAPLTDLGFYMLRESDRRIETLGVYESRTDTGKLLKCNSVNLRDAHGKIEAILCINIDVTAADQFPISEPTQSPISEHYQTSIDEVIRRMIADASADHPGELTREQKSDIVSSLEERGVFLARGAVRTVATALGIAEPTVYKYIQKARRTSPKTNGRRLNHSKRPANRSLVASA